MDERAKTMDERAIRGQNVLSPVVSCVQAEKRRIFDVSLNVA